MKMANARTSLCLKSSVFQRKGIRCTAYTLVLFTSSKCACLIIAYGQLAQHVSAHVQLHACICTYVCVCVIIVFTTPNNKCLLRKSFSKSCSTCDYFAYIFAFLREVFSGSQSWWVFAFFFFYYSFFCYFFCFSTQALEMRLRLRICTCQRTMQVVRGRV